MSERKQKAVELTEAQERGGRWHVFEKATGVVLLASTDTQPMDESEARDLCRNFNETFSVKEFEEWKRENRLGVRPGIGHLRR